MVSERISQGNTVAMTGWTSKVTEENEAGKWAKAKAMAIAPANNAARENWAAREVARGSSVSDTCIDTVYLEKRGRRFKMRPGRILNLRPLILSDGVVKFLYLFHLHPDAIQLDLHILKLGLSLAQGVPFRSHETGVRSDGVVDILQAALDLFFKLRSQGLR
jgi:hypothetical protein